MGKAVMAYQDEKRELNGHFGDSVESARKPRYSVPSNTEPRQGPFFHSSPADFQPGDMISTAESRGEKNRFNEGNRRQNEITQRHTYFTNDLEWLNRKFHGHQNHEERKAGSNQRLYEVEPTGSFSRDRNTHESQQAYKSPSPLRVVSEVHARPQTFAAGFDVTRRSQVPDDKWEQTAHPGRWEAKQRADAATRAQQSQNAQASFDAHWQSIRSHPGYDSERGRYDDGVPYQAHYGPGWQQKAADIHGPDYSSYEF
jgi:hypothetical protein